MKRIMFIILIAVFSFPATGQNLFQNGNMDEQGAWQVLRLQNGAGNISTTFGSTDDPPAGASGKCFKAEYTGIDGTSQTFVYQLLDLKGAHIYKFQCFFKDNTHDTVDLENIWVEALWIDPDELPQQDSGDIVGNVFLGINYWLDCGPGDDGNMVQISCDNVDDTYVGKDPLNNFVYFKVSDTIGGQPVTYQTISLAVGFTVGIWTDTKRSFDILLDDFYLEDIGPDTIVDIPDTAFLYALIDEGVDINGDSLISNGEAEAVNSLNVGGGISWGECIGGRGITSLGGIEAFINLDTLRCNCNLLKTLDLSANTALRLLECSGNELTSLDVSNITELGTLRCDVNQLTSLEVSNNIALTELACASNQLTGLNVSNNTALTDLSCDNNQLTSLDVSNNTVLSDLGCWYNQLTSLDISGCIALTGLNCHTNKLTSLDVSNNTALELLYCWNNQLISLDVSNCTSLRYLGCEGNQLTSLDITNNPALEGLNCGSTQLTNLDISNNNMLTLIRADSVPTLTEVCVWETFIPDSVDVDTTGSPNICFQTDCNGDCSIVGIADPSHSGVLVYPNPANMFLTIQTACPVQYNIEIRSIISELLYSTRMEGTALQVDLSSFQKGIYFITVRSRDQVWTEKIIKL